MLKKNTLIVALIAALPVLAQEEAPQPGNTPAPHWGAAGEMPRRQPNRPDMHKRMLEKFDADKDGQLSDIEKDAMKAAFGKRASRPNGMENMHPGNRRRPHSERPAMIEKFDTDKDGQLNEQEHAALKEAARKRHEARSERREEFRKNFMEKFDTDKDGQLSDAEKEAAKAARSERRGPKNKRGPRRPRGARPEGMPQEPATLEL